MRTTDAVGTKYIVFCSRALPLNNLPTLSDTVIMCPSFSAAKNILFCREGTPFANRSPERSSSSHNWAITNSHELSVWLHVSLVSVNSISLPIFDIKFQLACSLLPMLLLLARLSSSCAAYCYILSSLCTTLPRAQISNP